MNRACVTVSVPDYVLSARAQGKSMEVVKENTEAPEKLCHKKRNKSQHQKHMGARHVLLDTGRMLGEGEKKSCSCEEEVRGDRTLLKVPVSEDEYLAFYRPVWLEAKRRKKRADMECSLQNFNKSVSDTAAGVSDIVEVNLQNRALYAALDTLSEDDRRLMEALFFEGKTEREFSAESGILQKTINNTKNRILQRLRRKLEEAGESWGSIKNTLSQM
jgi:RNA polymerase sigma factor (sigma-70 family)